MTETDAQQDRCSRCGAMKSGHMVLQDANDAALAVLLCPRATYKSPRDADVPSALDEALQTLMDES